MRYNAKLRERYDLSLDGKQVCALVVGALVVVGGTFVLGMSLGRQLAPRSEPAAATPQPPLARLDDPMPPVTNEEPSPTLEAHDALVGRGDDALPVPSLNPPSVQTAAPAAPPATVEAVGAPAAPVATATTSAPRTTPEATGARAVSPPAVTASDSKPEAAKPEVAVQTRVEHGRDQTARRQKPTGDARTAAPARGAFTIQIGASSRRVDAERLAKRFQARRSRVIAANVPGKGRWYRVQVGSYPTRDAASRQLASLSRAGVHGIVTAVR